MAESARNRRRGASTPLGMGDHTNLRPTNPKVLPCFSAREVSFGKVAPPSPVAAGGGS